MGHITETCDGTVKVTRTYDPPAGKPPASLIVKIENKGKCAVVVLLYRNDTPDPDKTTIEAPPKGGGTVQHIPI